MTDNDKSAPEDEAQSDALTVGVETAGDIGRAEAGREPDEPEYEKRGDGVVLAFMFNEQTHGFFTCSVLDLFRYDGLYGSKYLIHEEGGYIALSTGPRVAEGRNQVVDQFAETHPSADWLFFVDSDMTFTGDILENLMQIAEPDERPIVGALCFSGGRTHVTYPTIWREVDIVRNKQNQAWANVERVFDYPKDALLKVAATGGAALLIHRSVFIKMQKAFGTLPSGAPNMYPWFSEGLVGPDGQPLGEDVAFCLRARMVGCDVYVHTGIRTGHMKSHEVNESLFDQEQALLARQNGPVDLTLSSAQPEAATPKNRAARRAANRKAQNR